MKNKFYLAILASLLSLNSFAAEKLNCSVRFDSTTERVSLKANEDGVVEVSRHGFEFRAFIAYDAINMVITKPADKNGYQESISASQVKPTARDGKVNMYLNSATDLILFECSVR